MKTTKTKMSLFALLLCVGMLACGEDVPQVDRPKPKPNPGTEQGGSNTGGENGGTNTGVETPDDTSATPTGSLDYAKLDVAPHPRILYTEADWKELKSKVLTTDFTRHVHETILANCDKYIGYTDLKYTISGGSILNVSRNALTRITQLAYAYRMTGKYPYLAKAERLINNVCEFDDWHHAHFLDVAEMATGVAIGLDWLYNDLKPATRELARRKIEEYAFSKTKGQSFLKNKANWNQVCNGGMIISALAMYEKDKARAVEMIEQSLASNKQYGYMAYGDSGAYNEGYLYWGYGTTYQVLMMCALEKIFGDDAAGLYSHSKGFQKTAEWMLHMLGPSRKAFNYADADEEWMGKFPMWYFAKKENDPSLLYVEKMLMKELVYCENLDEYRLAAALFAMMNIDHVKSEPVKPTQQLWWAPDGDSNTGVPQVIIHTDWTMSESDKFLGIVGGRSNRTHAHLDGGSFVYDAYGVRWAMDLGRPTYSTTNDAIGGQLWDYGKNSKRWDVFRLNNFGHNVVTINGTKHNSTSKAFIDSSWFDKNPGKLGGKFSMYGYNFNGNDHDVAANNNFPQYDSPTRVAEFINNNEDMMITDWMTACPGKNPTVRWTMVTPSKVTIVDDTHVKLEQAGKTLYLTFKINHDKGTLDPSKKLTLMTYPAKGPQSWDEPNTGIEIVAYELQLSSEETMNVSVIFSKNMY